MKSPTHDGTTWSNAKEDQIVLLPYDPQWATRFRIEAEAIEGVLPPKLNFRCEHFGSTAVPGLCAKPIIDILLLIDDVARWPELIAPLESLGYVYWEGNPRRDRYFFVKGMPPFGAARTHHVHVRTEADGALSLAFRDALRADAFAAKRYETLKRTLAQQYPTDREAYTQGKTVTIQRVLDEARTKTESER